MWSIAILSDNRIVSCSFHKSTDYVCCIKFLSEERNISGSENGELRIWCLRTNSCIQTINAHSATITEIQVLNDNQVASCSYAKTIKIWDLTSSSCIETFQRESLFESLDVFKIFFVFYA